MKQKGFAPILILLILAIIGVLGYFTFKYFQLSKPIVQINTPLPTPSQTTTPSEAPTPSSQGTVTGKLCYPSDFLPPGEIVAKDIQNSKTYTQNYPGSTVGGVLTYSFVLPVGTYPLKYQAHPDTNQPNTFLTGYYDECAKTQSNAMCMADSNHTNLPVISTVNQETQNIDLCDFYASQSQQDSLNINF
jgi:hypothetical protein